jgi:Ca2+-transporting ATPase
MIIDRLRQRGFRALQAPEEHLWHTLSPSATASILRTSVITGLSGREAERRLSYLGKNMLEKVRRISPLAIFISQFRDFMVLVLCAAALASLLLGELGDFITIITIVILNAFLGFIQEYRAERSLEALQQLAAPSAKVIRDGVPLEIKAHDVTPGDILVIDVGSRIAADTRLIEVAGLEVEESILTGESLPVSKTAHDILAGSQDLGDRRNMVFMGTVVTRGHGKGIVVQTGMSTEIGKIAHMVQEDKDETTPLQHRLERLGRILVAISITLCASVGIAGFMRGGDPIEMIMSGVSLAVAAIPEGLPAVVTIALALGVQRMGRRKAIVRRLPAVETLGCVTVICADKTGTLTRNEMTVREFFVGGKRVEVTGIGYAPFGEFLISGQRIDPGSEGHLMLALEIGVCCNNATLTRNRKAVNTESLLAGQKTGSAPRWEILGDPTEGALVVAAAKAGLLPHTQGTLSSLVHEIPFDSERKRMTTIHRRSKGYVAYTKGAPEVIINLCSYILESGRVRDLSFRDRGNILRENSRMASRGLRVLALAYRHLPELHRQDQDSIETNLILAGLVGMEDPPRDEVRKSVALAKSAGIRTVMITGDHLGTALSVARALGLAEADDIAITGAELDSMSDSKLLECVEHSKIFARVNPKHKLRIVKALKAHEHIVAMTGDGVNDAPAIREADIGIAMGLSGTDVTREAAAMVLADDNYATIVAAVEEGRAIYDNIRKFIRYLLACNAGEVLTMLLAVIIGLPLPLVPIQILWMNLVTDGLPAIALGVDPLDPEAMSREPRRPREGVFSQGLGLKIVSQGIIIGTCAIVAFIISLALHGEITRARTVAFTCLVMAQLIYVFHCRSEYHRLSETDLSSNLYLIGAVLISGAMQLLAVYLPVAQGVFRTVALDGLDWIIIFILSGWSSVFVVIAQKIRRLILRRTSVIRV